MDKALEQRAAAMFYEDVASTTLARFSDWNELRNDSLGRQVMERYIECARFEQESAQPIAVSR